MRARRQQLRLTQGELARQASAAGFKISQQGIANMESRGNVGSKALPGLAQALDVPARWLVHGGEITPPPPSADADAKLDRALLLLERLARHLGVDVDAPPPAA